MGVDKYMLHNGCKCTLPPQQAVHLGNNVHAHIDSICVLCTLFNPKTNGGKSNEFWAALVDQNKKGTSYGLMLLVESKMFGTLGKYLLLLVDVNASIARKGRKSCCMGHKTTPMGCTSTP